MKKCKECRIALEKLKFQSDFEKMWYNEEKFEYLKCPKCKTTFQFPKNDRNI